MATTSETEALAGDRVRLERVLLDQHRRFLAFVERRVGDRAQAEEVLQSAYVRALERGIPENDAEGVVAWFYRLLRNAIVDAGRRRDAASRGLERYAGEHRATVDTELEQAVCGCIHDVLTALKAEYAEVVQAVDLNRRSLAEVAAAHAITVNNATVRLHRARQALKKQLLRTCGACAAHGCLDCQCRRYRGPPATPGAMEV